jgi:hypothetical protein
MQIVIRIRPKLALAQTKLGEVALAQGDICAKLNDQAKARENFTDALMHFLKSEGIYESILSGLLRLRSCTRLVYPNVS